MLGAFKFVHFDAKHVIIQQGDRGDEFYGSSRVLSNFMLNRGKVARAAYGVLVN